MTTQTTSDRSHLAAYLALAAGVAPASLASGVIVGNTNLGLVIDPTVNGVRVSGSVNLGAGVGSLFGFFASGSASSSVSSGGRPSTATRSASVFFQPGQGWTGAGFIKGANAPYVDRLAAGAGIGASASLWVNALPGSRWTLASYYGSSYGSSVTTGGFWAGVISPDTTLSDHRGFLGFRVTGDAGTTYNYGWLDIEYDNNDPLGLLTIHGFGFNTTADQSILAGQLLSVPAPPVGALALLAAGAGGIRRTRRRLVA